MPANTAGTEMTISTTQNQVTFVGDGVSTQFAYGFPFITTSDLKVYVAGVQQIAGFTVSGISSSGGSGTFSSGMVSFSVAPSALAPILIYCDPDQLQSTSLPPNDPFPSKTVEKMVDKVTLLIQRLYTKFGNAITFPPGDTASGVLPSAADRASKTITFDASGNLQVVAPGAGTATALAIQLADTSSASNGDALVGVKYAAPSAVALNLHDYIEDDGSYNIMGFVPQGEKAAIRARTSTTDISANFETCISAIISERTYGRVKLPMGAMAIEAPIVPRYGISISGAGGLGSEIRCYDSDGITMIPGVPWDQNMSVFEDFGLIAMSGVNRSGFRCGTNPYVGEQDGMHLHRLRMFDWDIAINSNSMWASTIDKCWIERVNTAINIDEHGVLINILNSQIIWTGGGRGSATNCGINFGGDDIESMLVDGNFIFGFLTCIKAGFTWNLDICRNTLFSAGPVGATLFGINFTSEKERCNITSNMIEAQTTVGGSFTSIILQPNLTSTQSQVVVSGNRMWDDTSLGNSIGIQVNDAASSEQNNVIIENNNFKGNTVSDILVYNPKNIVVKNNDCRSTVPTNSISFLSPVTIDGLNIVEDNRMTKGLSYDQADVDSGLLQLGKNYINNTTLHYGREQPVDVVFNAGDYTANGAMTWTVGAGDVVTTTYSFSGKYMTVTLYLNTTTVAGAPNTQLLFKIPGGRLAARTQLSQTFEVLDNLVRTTGYAVVSAGGSTIAINKSDATNWTASVNQTFIFGQITFEVT